MVWSDEVLVMVSPLRAYEALAAREEPAPRRALARRVATFVGTFAVVGSLTTAGRFVAGHLLGIALAWSFVPMLQAVTIAITSRLAPKRLSLARAVELHMAGNGPYLAFFIGVAAVILGARDVSATFAWLVDSYVLASAGGAMIFGGAVTSYAFYRSCTGATRRRALGLLAVEWVVKVGITLAWFAAMDNLAPQLLGPRGSG